MKKIILILLIAAVIPLDGSAQSGHINIDYLKPGQSISLDSLILSGQLSEQALAQVQSARLTRMSAQAIQSSAESALAQLTRPAQPAQPTQSPKRTFESLFNHYNTGNKQGYTTTDISGEALRMFMDIASIDRIRIIMAKQPDDSFKKNLNIVLANGDYTFITSVKEAQKVAYFYCIKKYKNNPNSRLLEFLMVVWTPQSAIAMQVKGDFDIDAIKNLSGLNISGMDNIREIDNMMDR